MSSSEPALSPRAIANRKNAARSTGPKSAAGKSRSAKNAVKHGLTSEATTLPGEDPQVYDARLDEWLDHYQPSGPAEKLLVERAVRASWMLDRCTRAEDAALSTRIRHAADDFERAARDEAEALGCRLIDDDVNYCSYADPRSQTGKDLIEQRRRDDPPILALRLNSFAAGAEWLLARWRELSATLDRIGRWHYSETYRAIRLLGKRPVDVYDDSLVSLVMLAATAAHSRGPNAVYDIQRVFGQTHNRPDDYERVTALGVDIPDAATGLAMLQKVVASEIERLESRIQTHLAPLARLDTRCATEQAAFDASETGSLRHRYEASRERALHRALADLAKIERPPVQTVSPNPEQETTSEMASFRQDTPAPPETPPTEPPPPAPEPRPDSSSRKRPIQNRVGQRSATHRGTEACVVGCAPLTHPIKR